MKRQLRCCFLSCLIWLTSPGAAQQAKLKSDEFCGIRFDRLTTLKEQLDEQFTFLKLQEQDTIVDIGAASGWFEGALSAATSFKRLHFVLVDIDTSCLNLHRVKNMFTHYSGVKKEPIENSFELVHNTPDSLFLPANKYRKVWLLNVLHEVPGQQKLLTQIYQLLQPGGELVLLEIKPNKPGALHGGCNMPLRTAEEWTAILAAAGFDRREGLSQRRSRRQTLELIRFVRR